MLNSKKDFTTLLNTHQKVDRKLRCVIKMTKKDLNTISRRHTVNQNKGKLLRVCI